MPLFPTAFDASQFTLGILAAARGGTGVANTGTLTNASNTTITGGGTLALGGFTLTVPATGTAALLQVANTFTLGPNAFRAGADGNVALSARRHSSGASANMLELQNESGTALSYFGPSAGLVVNETGADVDSRFEGDTDPNLLYLDASTDRIGIGIATPNAKLNVYLSSAATNTVGTALALDHDSTGTPAAGFGTGLKFAIMSDTTNGRDAATINAIWTTATDASRTSALLFSTVNNAGALTEQMRIAGDGPVTVGASGSGPSMVNRYQLGVRITDTSTSGTNAVIAGQLQVSSSTTTPSQHGLYFEAGTASGNAATISSLMSARVNVQHRSATTINEYRGLYSTMAFTSGVAGTITTAKHILLDTPTLNSGTITTLIGLQVNNMTGATTNKAIETNAGLVVFNEGGDASADVRFEGDTDQNLFFTDASADLVGIGTNAPASKLHTLLANATTNAVDTVLTIGHNSTGTAAAGFGGALLWTLESSTTNDQSAASWGALWATATHASRKAQIVGSVYDTAAREWIRGEASGTAAMIGFLGAAAVVQQTSGADLTNNVTSGGTDNTIANFTDLTTYANDAATIRNDIYQLARKLKQVNDALRLYGLLT